MSVCVCSTNLGFSVEKIVLVLVWGTSKRLVPAKKKKNAWYQRALRCQLRGRPFHPWAGPLRFSGAATLTQSSSFSCGAGLQSESRLLLYCTHAVYMLAADAAVRSGCCVRFRALDQLLQQKDCLGFSVGYQRAPGTSEKKTNAKYQRALRCQLRGRPFHPWAG